MVGAALLMARQQIMATTRSDLPKGGRFLALWVPWLKAHAGLRALHAAERTGACWVAERLPDIRAWRDGLPQAVRLRMHHPSNVRGAFLRWQRAKDMAGGDVKPAPAKPNARDLVQRL